jgi:hypothetical protein
MNTIGILYLILGSVIVAVILLLSGCADVKDDFIISPAESIKVHGPGFENPAASNFHGNILRNNNWNWTGCQECHGEAPNFTGGVSGVSCGTAGCHVDDRGVRKSIVACNTCHGDFHARANDVVSFAPPRDLSRNNATTARGVGAHQIHLRGGANSDAIECKECHTVPAGVFVGEHLTPKGAAKLVFGEMTFFDTEGADMTANPPTYNPDDTGGPSCSNTLVSLKYNVCTKSKDLLATKTQSHEENKILKLRALVTLWLKYFWLRLCRVGDITSSINVMDADYAAL